MYPLEAVSWFPQADADVFFAVKGLVALISTVLLLVHMNRSWYRLGSFAQRMRYITLFIFSALGAGGSLEQISEGSDVSYRHIAALLVFVFLAWTSVISIRENKDESPLKRHKV